MRDERKQELMDYGMQKAVIREKRYKGYPNFKDWGDYYDKGNEETRMFYKKMRRFLETNVNRPYKNVYAEFCALYPSRLGTYTDTRKEFRRMCGTNGENNYSYSEYSHPFYVTEKGILKKNLNSWDYRKKPKKTAIIGYSREAEGAYIFNKKWFKYPEVVEYINSTIGESNTTILKESEFIPKKLVEVLHRRWKVNWTGDDNFFWSNKHWRDCENWVYKAIINTYPITVTKGTDEYTRYKSEEQQAIKRQRKKTKINKEIKASTLLHDIEQKKKDKEIEQNIIDRDRLGFDEESFKGEYYHGQKRKKK